MISSDVLQYLPQRPPFVMIDTLLQADDAAIKTAFTIREDNMLVADGIFTEAGLVENMAQTAAAGMGYRARQSGRPPQVGFIGALKGLKIFDLPRVGEIIHTEIIFAQQVLNVHIVQGSILSAGRAIATCELKIFLQTETS